MKTRQLLFLCAFILIAFLFTRLYGIREGYFFFNDMGRDMYVLYQWKDTLKPPLLGPQNSALPFNQPALYFYWLMPLYVLSGFSIWSNLITLLTSMIAAFGFGVWLLRRQGREAKEWWWLLLLFAWLVVLNPAHIGQNRFVWNPSFVTPSLSIALFALAWLRQHWSKWAAQLFSFFLVMAVAFSYSVVPLAVVVGILLLWWWRKEPRKLGILWASLIGWGIFFQLPTLVFELRYRFQLTRAILFGERLPQEGVEFTQKLHNLLQTGIGGSQGMQYFVILILLSTIFWQLYILLKKSQKKTALDKVFLTILPIWVGTLLVTFLSPVPLHSHYVFGILVTTFLLMGSMRRPLSFFLLILFTLVWLLPGVYTPQFRPARRSVAQLQSCARFICEQEKDPLFVSVQADDHPYHNGPEFRYAFAEAGCAVRSIETAPGSAAQMAVVVDNSEYRHGRNSFYELSLFGPSSVVRDYRCPANVRVFILERE